MYRCETCGSQVRPASDPGVVYAVELVKVFALGSKTIELEGRSAFFHRTCFPVGSMQWRMKSMPTAIDDGDADGLSDR
jgi:hypothetical protein